MKTNISKGDFVLHVRGILNNDIQMIVVDISDTHAKVAHFDKKGVDKEEWFHFSELLLTNKIEIDFGE